MPQTCTICRHPERDVINAALIAQEPIRSIAKRTGTTAAAVFRHKQSHLPLALTKAAREVEVVQGTSLLEQAEFFQAKTLSILVKAEEAGDYHIALAAVREGRANVELLERCLEKEREENSPEQRMKRLEAENQMLARQLAHRQDQRKLPQQQTVRQNQLLTASHKALDLFEEDTVQTPSPTRAPSLLADGERFVGGADVEPVPKTPQLASAERCRALPGMGTAADGATTGPFDASLSLGERIARMAEGNERFRTRVPIGAPPGAE